MSFLPIAEISPYRTGWTIKGKVTFRQETRSFASKTKPGQQAQVFTITIVDAKGTEIQATFWDEAAVKFDFLKEGGVYTFTKGRATLAKKQYNRTSHNYDLGFGQDAVIAPAEDDNSYKSTYNLKELKDLRTMSLPAYVDLCVMVKSQGPTRDSTRKSDNSPLYIRRLIGVDQSECSLEIAMFDTEKSDVNYENQCILIKSCALKEYNGGISATISPKAVAANVDHPAVTKLQAWWAASGKDITPQPLTVGGAAVGTKEGTFEDITAAGTKMQVGAVEYYNAFADLSMVRNEKKDGTPILPTYKACSTCNTKLAEDAFCNKCSKAAEPMTRLMLQSMKFQDTTQELWMNAFDSAAATILNQNAEQVKGFQDSMEILQEKCIARCHYGQYDLKLKVKCDSYQGEAKTKVSILTAAPADPVAGGQKLLQTLAKLYPTASPEAQAEVQGLLKGDNCLQSLPGFAQSWETDVRGLVAAVA
jgi:replication factor A1